MKKNITITLLAISVLLFTYAQPEKATWSMDKAHSKLGFTVTHLSISEVEGFFRSFDAKITTTGNDFSNAEVEMTAETKSIYTDNDKRDEHLRSADFFDAAKYPTVTFKSTSFKKTGDNVYKLAGNLTMHGVTKPITFDVNVRTGMNPQTKKPVAGFKITGSLNRKDWGIGMNANDAMISDAITLVANAEFAKN